MSCPQCLKPKGHHPNCPNAEDMPEPTFTIWRVGTPVDVKLRNRAEMRTAAQELNFCAEAVLRDGEADIVMTGGVVIGGCYIDDEGLLDYE